MYSLNLDIVKGVEWDVDAGPFFNPSLKLSFALSLDINELLHESLVGGVGHKLLEVIKRSNPFINSTKSFTNKIGESWVAAVNPSSWSNTVGLVLQLAWIKLIKLGEDCLLEKVRVKSSDTIDSVGADDGEVGHSNLLWISLLDKTHSLHLGIISWIH